MRSRTIRFRTTVLATIFVIVGLVLSGVALVVLQRNALTAGIDAALEQRVAEISQVEGGTSALPAFVDGFAQLVGPDGLVLSSTPNLDGVAALAAGDVEGFVITQVPEVDDDSFRVLTKAATDGSVIIVGSSYDPVGESVAALLAAMALIVPILTVVFAALIWWMVGRTLQPVEVMRQEVAGIGAGDLGARLAEPHTDDEIGRLAVMLNEMLARIEASTQRQRQFVADASHELRSPLTRLRARLELAEKDPSSRKLADPEALLEEVIGMQTLVEDMLHLARADSGDGAVEFRPLDLDDVVLREGRKLKERGRVGVDLSGVSAAYVVGDAGQLARAVRNIMENAERYARNTIEVSLIEEDGFGVVVVADDGPGVDPADAERIFGRFARLDESRTAQTGGAGLGLAIAREIAGRHGGTLRLKQDTGLGATFELKIPLVAVGLAATADDGDGI